MRDGGLEAENQALLVLTDQGVILRTFAAGDQNEGGWKPPVLRKNRWGDKF